MTEKNSDSITTVLKDVESGHEGSLRVRVVANESAISICPDGYGDFGSAKRHGCPIFLELHRGRLRLVVFADINREDPPHIIDLEDAREDRRNET